MQEVLENLIINEYQELNIQESHYVELSYRRASDHKEIGDRSVWAILLEEGIAVHQGFASTSQIRYGETYIFMTDTTGSNNDRRGDIITYLSMLGLENITDHNKLNANRIVTFKKKEVGHC